MPTLRTIMAIMNNAPISAQTSNAESAPKLMAQLV